MSARRSPGPTRALLVAGVLAASSAAAAAPGAADGTTIMAVPVATEVPTVAAMAPTSVPAPRLVAATPTAHAVVAAPTVHAAVAAPTVHAVATTPTARLAPVHPSAATTPVAPVAPILAATPAPVAVAAAPATTPAADAANGGPMAAVAAALAAEHDKAAPAWLRKDSKVTAPALAGKESPSPLRVGGMLALVATLGGIAYYARRRRQLAPAKPAKEQLRVLGSTRVGPKATAVVVEIAGKRILLGVTDQSVSNLAWLDDEPSQAAEDREVSSLRATPASRPSAAPEAQGPSGFLKLLRNAVGSPVRQVIPSDEIARTTRDEVRLSHRESKAQLSRDVPRDHDDEILEGQVMGLVKRRKESS